MSIPPPLALTPCLPHELVTFILKLGYPTTLIICGTRNAFFNSLFKSVSNPIPALEAYQEPLVEPEQPVSPSEAIITEEEDQGIPQPQTPARHPLLIPTLYQISRSRHVTLVFIPTVSHLRAYLAVLTSNPPLTAQVQQRASMHDMQNAHTPLLLIYGLIEAHRGTSEWSTQGLGNTLAGVVEAGARTSSRVIVVEEMRAAGEKQDTEEMQDAEERLDIDRTSEDENETELQEEKIDTHDEERIIEGQRLEGQHQGSIWHEKLPILNGSASRIGADMEYWGRTVEVGTVLRRWFKFEKGDWGANDHA